MLLRRNSLKTRWRNMKLHVTCLEFKDGGGGGVFVSKICRDREAKSQIKGFQDQNQGLMHTWVKPPSPSPMLQYV